MKKEKEITGYPHIDKPWMKWYRQRDIDCSTFSLPKMNIVEYLKKTNIKNFSQLSSMYYGMQKTYDEFIYNCNLSSKVLTQLGVKKDDIILFLVPNIPQEEEICCGAMQIGAICDYIDPRPDSMNINTNAKKVLELIRYEKPKFIISIDQCYLGMLKPIEKEIKELGINNIILLDPIKCMDSNALLEYYKDIINYDRLKNGLNIIDNFDSNDKIKNNKLIKEYLISIQKQKKILEEAKQTSLLKIFDYDKLKKECVNCNYEIVNDPNQIIYIGHTSGTSGSRPKPIPITNVQAIASMIDNRLAGVGPNQNETSLHIIPGFAAFGRFNNGFQTYANKGINIHIPEFIFSEFGYLIKKYKPNSIMVPPAFLSTFLDCHYLEKENLEYLKKILYGGDSMTIEDEEKINEWLKQHGCKAVIEKGHGMSELVGGCSYASGDYNKLGSIGIPFPNTTYSIVDPDVEDQLIPLKFEKGMDRLKGEVVISSPHLTNGILHNNIIFPIYELDGKKYIRTKDLGEMDKDGVFYINARKDRSFARIDGYKVKPYEIEKEILKNENIHYAIIVDYYDDRIKGIMPICHVILKENCNEDKLQIVNDIVYKQIISNPTMCSRQIPSKFKFRCDLPLTQNNKINFNALRTEKLDGSEINVDIYETNISIDKIEIYYAKNNIKKLTKN